MEERYLQIFNMSKTFIFWKQMPKRFFIHEKFQVNPGLKAFKSRITLMPGGHDVGHKLKSTVL